MQKIQKQKQEYDAIFVLLPTSPLVQINDILKAKILFENSSGKTVLSVCETETPPFNTWIIAEDETLKPCFPNSKYKFTKSTECPKTFQSNGAILICDVKTFLKNSSYRIGPIVPYLMPRDRSIDIDTAFDFQLAEFMISKNK